MQKFGGCSRHKCSDIVFGRRRGRADDQYRGTSSFFNQAWQEDFTLKAVIATDHLMKTSGGFQSTPEVVQTAVHSVMMFTTSQKMQIFIWMFRTLWTHPAGSKELSDPPAGTVNVFQSLLGHCNLGYHQTHIRSAWLTPHSTKATAFVSSLESTDGKLQMIRRQISNNKEFSSSVLRHRGQRLANTSLKETTTLNFQRLLTNAAWRPDNKGTLRLKTSAGLQTWFHQ